MHPVETVTLLGNAFKHSDVIAFSAATVGIATLAFGVYTSWRGHRRHRRESTLQHLAAIRKEYREQTSDILGPANTHAITAEEAGEIDRDRERARKLSN